MEKQEMIVDHTKEKNKKRWKNKAATFYYVCASSYGKPARQP